MCCWGREEPHRADGGRKGMFNFSAAEHAVGQGHKEVFTFAVASDTSMETCKKQGGETSTLKGG
jgi:hypothetical protein